MSVENELCAELVTAGIMRFEEQVTKELHALSGQGVDDAFLCTFVSGAIGTLWHRFELALIDLGVSPVAARTRVRDSVNRYLTDVAQSPQSGPRP